MWEWMRSWIRLYVFPSGRRMWAYQRVWEISTANNILTIAEIADEGVQLETKAREYTAVWRTGVAMALPAKGGTSAFDPTADRLVTAIYVTPESAIKALPADHPTHKLAVEFRAKHFPDGAVAITALPYEEEIIALEELLTGLNHEDAALAVKTFGLGTYIEELETIVPQYRFELENSPAMSGIRHAQVAQAMRDSQNHLIMMTATILGTLTKQPEIQKLLLAPIENQQKQIAAAVAGRKKPKDIHPHTGEEIDDIMGTDN